MNAFMLAAMLAAAAGADSIPVLPEEPAADPTLPERAGRHAKPATHDAPPAPPRHPADNVAVTRAFLAMTMHGVAGLAAGPVMAALGMVFTLAVLDALGTAFVYWDSVRPVTSDPRTVAVFLLMLQPPVLVMLPLLAWLGLYWSVALLWELHPLGLAAATALVAGLAAAVVGVASLAASASSAVAAAVAALVARQWVPARGNARKNAPLLAPAMAGGLVTLLTWLLPAGMVASWMLVTVAGLLSGCTPVVCGSALAAVTTLPVLVLSVVGAAWGQGPASTLAVGLATLATGGPGRVEVEP